MEDSSGRRRVALAIVAASIVGCGTEPSPERVASPRETLQAIGRRLGESSSASELSSLASRGDALLELLRRGERAALARGYLRFKVEAPVVVHVAAPRGSIPFWLEDQGFRATELTLENEDTSWRVFKKTFNPGWVGLGVNGLDRAPLAHYVVFIQAASAETACGHKATTLTALASHESIGDWLSLNARDEQSWKLAIARPGISAAHDVYRPFREMPRDLEGSVLLQPSHAARHSAMLATGRVWKTHVVSSFRPDQVAVSFGSDPARELVWTWRTAPGNAPRVLRLTRERAAPRVQRFGGPSNMAVGEIRTIRGESARLETANLLNDPVVLRHRAVATGLEPDSVYRYSIGDGSRNGWGPWRTVKTGPDRSGTVRFLYLGDPQTGLEGWGKLLKAAYFRNPQIDFISIGGDLVDRGNERTNWDHFFLRAAGVFDRVPLMPCAGNHEYLDMGPRLYRAFFELPHNGPEGIDPGLVYHFQCGDALFAVLDSTLAVSDPRLAQRQADWLDAALERTRATWKVVIFHHPVYPSHPWRDTPVLRAYWVPVFDKHHVDLVLQGHDHAYLRTYPLRAHRRVGQASAGTIYVIAVSGDKFVEQPRRDYIQVGKTSMPTYQTIEIDSQSNRLNYQARALDGRLVDELHIEKRPRSCNQDGSIAGLQ
jgi:hypothetical protein